MITCFTAKCRSTGQCQSPIKCSGAGPEVDAAILAFHKPERADTIPASLPFERGCWDWLDELRTTAMAECRSLGLVYAGLVQLGVVR